MFREEEGCIVSIVRVGMFMVVWVSEVKWKDFGGRVVIGRLVGEWWFRDVRSN